MWRTPMGFDYMDQMLDIVVAPDFSWYRWKDEDELLEGVRLGLWDSAHAGEIHDEAERAWRGILARRPSLDKPRKDWRPDPLWSIPKLIRGWDKVQ